MKIMKAKRGFLKLIILIIIGIVLLAYWKIDLHSLFDRIKETL